MSGAHSSMEGRKEAKRPKLIKIPAKPELSNLLECKICLEVPVNAKVFVCEKGHSWCEDCQTKITKCPFCGSQFKGGRNFRLEEIIDAMSFVCSNTGCSKEFKGSESNKHSHVCEFRLLNCYETKWREQCLGKSIEMNNFMTHLVNFHERKAALLGDWVRISEDYYWPGFCFIWEENIFLANIVRTKEDLHIWMCLIGNEKDAKMFKCTIEIEQIGDSNNKESIEWNGPLQSNKFKGIPKRADHLKISLKSIKRFVFFKEGATGVVNFRFNVSKIKDEEQCGKKSCEFINIKLNLVCTKFSNEMEYSIGKSTKFAKLKSIYSKTLHDIPVTSLRFTFEGRRIDDDDTPNKLGMKNDDAIEIYIWKY